MVSSAIRWRPVVACCAILALGLLAPGPSARAASIDAVELNPQMTRLVAATYADFAGHLYDDERITVHTREARGFVAQSKDQYDLIHIGLLDSFAASGSGVQALNESYLYTAEAIGKYLEHTAAERSGYLNQALQVVDSKVVTVSSSPLGLVTVVEKQ